MSKLVPTTENAMPFDLKFAMPLKMRTDLDQNTYRSWKNLFENKTVYLIGWCDTAFVVVYALGDYYSEPIGMKPWDLFEPAE